MPAGAGVDFAATALARVARVARARFARAGVGVPSGLAVSAAAAARLAAAALPAPARGIFRFMLLLFGVSARV